MNENLTIGMGWGSRTESARECAERLWASIEDIPAQRDLFSEWLIVPEGGASNASELLSLPTDLDGLTVMVEASRLKNDRGEVMEGSGFSFTLARLHRDRPVIYRVRCSVERERPGNHVQFDFPHPDHSDPAAATAAVVTAAFTSLVLAWRPTYASVSTYSFRKAQKIQHRSGEIPVGWLTYLSDSVDFNQLLLADTIAAKPLCDGLAITLRGAVNEPSLEDALRVREALGYGAP